MAGNASEGFDRKHTLNGDLVPLINRLGLDAEITGQGALAAAGLDRTGKGFCAHGEHSKHDLAIGVNRLIADEQLGGRNLVALRDQAMSDELAQLLRHGRESVGLSLDQAAQMIGVSNQAINQWEMGKSAPDYHRHYRIADTYKLNKDTLGSLISARRTQKFSERSELIAKRKRIAEKNSEIVASILPNVSLAPSAPMEVTEAQIYLPLDVPVLGVSMGGEGHDFQFNGETVDHVRRPLGIAKAKRAYATYVVGDSMVPAFREGAVLFVNPDRPPSIGDDVVIELHPVRDGEPGAGYIKRLKKRTSTKIIVEQFNPPDDLEFDLADVKAMHRVVPWNELLGI